MAASCSYYRPFIKARQCGHFPNLGRCCLKSHSYVSTQCTDQAQYRDYGLLLSSRQVESPWGRHREFNHYMGPEPKPQGTLMKRREKDCVSYRIKECAVRLCLLVISEPIPIRSHQCGGQNKNWTRTTIDMLKQARWRLQGLTPSQVTTGI